MAAHGAHAPPQTPADETIQTTTNHPWLTADHGWILASFLHVGEPVQRADGATAIVVGVRAEPGVAAMWDLTVSDVHTFAVGSGWYVVHNCGFNELADAHAEELASKVTPKPFMRQWATIGVGYVEEADGTITRVVSLSNGASSTLERTLRASLDVTDNYLERDLRRGAAVHAEDYILDYAQGEGRSLRGIGASNDFCPVCRAKIGGASPGLLR